MKRANGNRLQPSAVRRGYTLLELMVTMAISVILVGGLATSLFLASEAAQFDSSVDHVWQSGQTIDQMTHDLQTAQSFSEWTPTAVTFTAPDRNGDSLPETIRYWWSGVPGDPLRKEFNGQPTIIAEDVHDFDLRYVTRTF